MSGRRHAPPVRILYAGMARRKASPGGEAGSPQGLTDEVEAVDYHHGLVRHCSLQPHPVRLEPDHRSRGITATGSHIDFGFAARSTSLQGKALAGATLIAPTAPHPAALRPPSPRGRRFLCPGRLFRRFLPLNIRYLAGEACLAPTVHRREFSPITPSAGYIFFSAGRRRRRCRRPGSGGP